MNSRRRKVRPKYVILQSLPVFAYFVFMISIVQLDGNIDDWQSITFFLFSMILFTGSLFVGIKTFRNRLKDYNLYKLKNLDEDLYGYYSKLTNEFKYVYPTNDNYPIDLNQAEMLRLENFIVILIKHERLLPLYRNKFESLHYSDGMFYQLIFIYSTYYLLENDIEKFKKYYKPYKDNIYLRTESRVLNEKLNEIHLIKDKYIIPVGLIDTMYQYYVLGLPIDSEIMNYHPRSKLDELLYITILYHYLEATENSKLLSDVEEEYIKYKEIRNSL